MITTQIFFGLNYLPYLCNMDDGVLYIKVKVGGHCQLGVIDTHNSTFPVQMY